MANTFKDKIDDTEYVVADNDLSNTNMAFKPERRKDFIIWVRKNYPKDCWCKHIDEYADAEKAKLIV